jgi:hypothetical protein
VEALGAFLDGYPALQGHQHLPLPSGTLPASGLTSALVLNVQLPLREGENSMTIYQRLAPRFNGVRVLYSCVDGCGKPDHPLVLWWAVLLVLAELVRYRPDQWLNLINVDKHGDASLVEQLLMAAQEEIPRLTLHALSGDLMDVPG